MSSIGSVGAGTILGTSVLSQSLSFEALLSEQHDLAIKTVMAGLNGLLDSLSESGVYQLMMNGFSDAVELTGVAGEKVKEKPFSAATPAQGTANLTALDTPYDTKINGFELGVNSAQTQAVNARNGTTAGTAERTAGDKVVSAAGSLVALRNAMDATVPDTSNAAATVNEAQIARDAAYAAWVAAPAGARKDAALAVLNSAENVLAQAQTLKTLADSSLTKVQGQTPTYSSLGDGYTLATWGNSGVMTLFGPDGTGVLINNDGTVDNFGLSGKGWKFNNTSTFVLPNETKVTFTPGTPASALITRGDHKFTVSNLRPGQSPVTSAYSGGGRKADKQQNDGYIFTTNGATSGWKTSSGAALGDETSREIVATSPLNNEVKLDPTDVALSPELQAFVQSTGLIIEDYDGDGKYNDEELFAASQAILAIVEGLQAAFAAALLRIAQASGALNELTTFLEKVKADGNASQDEKTRLSSEEAATLADIERRLVAAFQALKGEPAGNASNAGQVPQGPSNNNQTEPSSPSSENSSLQRLGRLLSGFGTVNIPDLPPTQGTTPPEVLNLAQALQDLKQLLVGQGLLDATLVPGQLPPLPEISAGLQAFLNALAANPEVAALGLPPTQDGQYFLGLFSNLNYATLSQQELQSLAPSLLGLVGYFAELAEFQDQAGLGAIDQESRFAENLQLVLQGLASLSTPGFDQSAPGALNQPTPEQIRAGLALFLSALATLGLFAPPPPTTPSGNNSANGGIAFEGNREQIKTITSNFYTDPKLLQRLNEHLQQALQLHTQQLSRASTLFTEAQEAVRKFVALIKQDGLVTDLVFDDALSDLQQDKFADKMKELQKQWGVEWGNSTPSTPAEELNLLSRVMQSGTMV